MIFLQRYAGILSFIVVIAMTPCAHATLTTRLDVSTNTLFAGDLFDISVYIDDITDEVIAFGFNVTFAASEFQYNNATVASTFFDDSTHFPSTDVAGHVFPGPGPTGDNILLAQLNFTSLIPGNFTLGIVSDLADPNEGLFQFSSATADLTKNVFIHVNDPGSSAPVPEPSTVILLAMGIGTLIGTGRRRGNTG